MSNKANWQLVFLAKHLNMPRGKKTMEEWPMALAAELQRKLDTGEEMPPPCPEALR
jgi:hypothetical protein